MDIKHYSVLKDEVIDKMNINPEGIYVDATLGLGGHSEAIAEKLTTGKLIAFDQDDIAIERAKERLSKFTNIEFVRSNFANLEQELNKLGIEKIDGILYDLGTSFYQLTDESRGFTYHGDSILDMRMDMTQELDAKIVLNTYSESELARVFKDYGEESRAKQLAAKIVEIRQQEEITTNVQLNEIIKMVKGFQKDKHPSKNIYQAIRIEVNNELHVITDSLHQAIKMLKVDGRALVISFHSLEDITTKKVFHEYKKQIIETPMENKHLYHTLKTVYPTKQEVEENKASRSAKLRVIIKKHE